MNARLYVGLKTKSARACGDEHLLRGREPLQLGWYAFASGLVQGQTVLDVGCGSGEGLKLLHASAKTAVGIDLDDRLTRLDVEIQHKDISAIPDKAFDVVVCIDVIEHVEDDKRFVSELCRVARRTLFVSTPNLAVGRNTHPYHIREYAPHQFRRLFSQYGRVRLFGGSSTGEIREEINGRVTYHLVNLLYTCRPTVLLAKILKRMLIMKVWPHQAVIVTLGEAPSASPGEAPQPVGRAVGSGTGPA